MPLNGTTNLEHMELGVQILKGKAGELSVAEMQAIRSSLY
jgi:hypothetical protein